MLERFSGDELQRAYDAGLITCESLTERIQLKCRFGDIDRPAAAAVAGEYGYKLAPEEVRAGAPRRFLRPSTV